jgi:glycerate-2-kinase
MSQGETTQATEQARALLRRSFDAAVAAADPRQMLAQHLPDLTGYRRVLAVGAGKAGGAMAVALEQACAGKVEVSGIVVTRYHHALPTNHIRGRTLLARRHRVTFSRRFPSSAAKTCWWCWCPAAVRACCPCLPTA